MVTILKKCDKCRIDAYQMVKHGNQINKMCRCGGNFNCKDNKGNPILTEVV